ncbi:MAG: purine-nucleoside phosphorylase [Deltaproteobacteria bacterium]|nr:purine-nucleoside phosphorylase [Deltaproteobacteria bacterium]
MATPWNLRVKETVDFFKHAVDGPPQVVVILSGGLQTLTEALDNKQVFHNQDIPNFPKPTAEGHRGDVVFGTCAGQRVAVLMGRSHYYEGYSMLDITMPLHALHVFGAKTLLISNAAGGINPSYTPGDLMVIRDHINFMGDNPLRGIANQSKQQFVDMTNAYTPSLRQAALSLAPQVGVTLHEGVYLATSGPSYETPAEIRAFRNFGADAVGMSTIPEVIVANFHRMQVMGISCIANLAADLHSGGMNHAEVLRAVKGAEPHLVTLFLRIIERLGGNGVHVNAA